MTEATGAPFLQISGLRKAYGNLEALRGVDLELRRGEFLCLFGPNGAGKSTLLKIIATLLRPDSGRIRVLDNDLQENPEAYRARLGMVSHQPFVYQDLSLLENLEFYAALYGVKQPRKRALKLLQQVKLIQRCDMPAGDLSRGMQQRLSIARALVNDPELLLLDEPYTGLDEHAARIFGEQLRMLHDNRRTIIMVTHNLRRGMESATRLGILARGRLAYLQEKDQVDPASFEALYFQHLEAS
ncbi:heme ABC exporter ATP-binding protein CcmA [Geothermobacter hydrogeniphilus]|nr:heme ABC exporter ATP-binding protein CcmA [Geothermobacter hydrogeniphilus]